MEDVRQATERPWSAEGPDMFGDWNIVPPKNNEALAIAAVVKNMRPAKVTAANAALIVRAVNSYDRYEIALQVIANAPPGTEGSEYRAVAKAALKGETGL